tara:strand:- start:163 stop:291 length:129 start_codon:yes stop_codon:yes gene_type:complete
MLWLNFKVNFSKIGKNRNVKNITKEIILLLKEKIEIKPNVKN